LLIGAKNRLLPVFPIDEHEYVAAGGIQGWQDVLQKVVAYCLIEFLKSNKNRTHLKKCRTCSSYFIARQPKTQKFCKKECRLKWHNPQLQDPVKQTSEMAGLDPVATIFPESI
jgi:hypothetical protein